MRFAQRHRAAGARLPVMAGLCPTRLFTLASVSSSQQCGSEQNLCQQGAGTPCPMEIGFSQCRRLTALRHSKTSGHWTPVMYTSTSPSSLSTRSWCAFYDKMSIHGSGARQVVPVVNLPGAMRIASGLISPLAMRPPPPQGPRLGEQPTARLEQPQSTLRPGVGGGGPEVARKPWC